jgi:hypothetical protein
MIQEYVFDIATQMGMKLSHVSLVDGYPLGCQDSYILNVAAEERIVSALVFQTDLDNLRKQGDCDRLEVKTRITLSRLQMLLDPRNYV